MEILLGIVRKQPRLLLRQRRQRQTLHIGAHAVQIGRDAAVHRRKHAAVAPLRRNLVGSLKSVFRIRAASEQDNLLIELRFARFIGSNQQRVGLLFGGKQGGEIGLQPVFVGKGVGEEQAEQQGEEGIKAAE